MKQQDQNKKKQTNGAWLITFTYTYGDRENILIADQQAANDFVDQYSKDNPDVMVNVEYLPIFNKPSDCAYIDRY